MTDYQTDSLSKPMDRILAMIEEFQLTRQYIRDLGFEPPPAPVLAAEIQRQKFTYRKNARRRIGAQSGITLPKVTAPTSTATMPDIYAPIPEDALAEYDRLAAERLTLEMIPAKLDKESAEQAKKFRPFLSGEVLALIDRRLQEYENESLTEMAGKALF